MSETKGTPSDPKSSTDTTVTAGESGESSSQNLVRGLQNRHLQLISIGGAIGTGLFMGSGRTISLTGPSVIVTYLIIGLILFFVMRAMGELLLSNLDYKSFRDIAADKLGPFWGFITGWTYWFCWIATGSAEVVAIAGYAQFWWPDLPTWVPIVVSIVVLTALNMVAVRLFGELEFWFSLIKIIAIVGLIAVGLVVVFTAFTAPNGTVASFSNLFPEEGWFTGGFNGFLAAFQIALFAFVGIELAGTAAAETKDPRKTLPKAISSIPMRILLFYVLALIVIMMVIPWDQVSPEMSPFVNTFTLVGLPAAAGIVNFVVLTSAASSCNSGLFSTTRMLYGLALDKAAPRTFARISSRGVPVNGLIFSGICLMCSLIVSYAGNTIMEAFTLITTVASVLFMVIWSIIVVSYLVYARRNPDQRAISAFKMPGGQIMCWVVLVFFICMYAVLLYEADTRIAALVTPIWFVVLIIAWFALRKVMAKPGVNSDE